ncbi:MAG TPA: sugar nucleotide-binding protein [Candidatus Acidoferrum sp.]|nr:sugar nucleotide-binding protein [Candidatus Acidoferrum sp.]
MKFLVVGASGFVGRNLLAHVQARGFAALGTQAHSREAALVTFDLLRHRIMDCVDRSFFQGTEPVHAVISAVISDMDLCLTDRAMAHAVNVEKTIQLINDLTDLNAKTTFLSTCFVFDGRTGYYSEDAPCSPANEYGRHKAEVEEHLRRRVPGAFVPRMDKIVGDNPRDHQLLAHWHKRIRENQPIICLEGSLLSPTSVHDIARGIVLACEMGLTGVYHLANSEFFYRDELARQFCLALGKPPNVISKPLAEFRFPDNRALKSYLDGSRFAKETGLRFTSMREVFRAFARRLQDVAPK